MKLSRVLCKTFLTVVALSSLCILANASDIKLGIGTVTASSLYLRSSNTTASKAITAAPKGDKVVILDEAANGWYEVEYNSKVGYMSATYLELDRVKNVELGYATVSVSSVNVRSQPTTSSSVVTAASRGAKGYIIGFNNGWYKVKINNKTGYIRSDLMELPDSFDCNSGTNLNSVIEYAKQFLGVPYVWGGTTPNPGFDCSGFTQYVCRHFGVKINRVAVDQMRNGVAVSRNNLKVGDLVFFERTYNTTDAASHVGFYVGNNQFIHAADAGIKISSLNETYYATRYVGARRVF